MSTTVIFSNAGDEDCKTLNNLWNGIEDVNLIELKHNESNSKSPIIESIQQEDDLLIFCGHGSPNGLFNPSLGSGWSYAFTHEDVRHIKAHQVIAIWCYAKDFWKHHINKGFNILTSSMYISNSREAYYNGFRNIPQDYINRTNNATFSEMNRYLNAGIPASQWEVLLMNSLDSSNCIDTFNRNGMTYYGK